MAPTNYLINQSKSNVILLSKRATHICEWHSPVIFVFSGLIQQPIHEIRSNKLY